MGAHHSHTHDHAHAHGHDSRKVLIFALAVTGGFAVVELIGGWLANSLALISDAGHMATDTAALGLGALAAAISRVGATRRYSYGLQRAEVLGALVNVLFMFAVVGAIVVAAIDRLANPQPVGGLQVMLIATMGLIVNLVVLRILHGGEQTLNTRGAMLHVMGDLLGSVAALLAGLVVWRTGWTPVDPLLSLLICALILVSSTRLLLDAMNVVMEAVPQGVSLSQVGEAMIDAADDVVDVHDLHIWTLSSSMRALSAHVVVRDLARWDQVLPPLRTVLHEHFGIGHVTLQPEVAAEDCAQAAGPGGADQGRFICGQ